MMLKTATKPTYATVLAPADDGRHHQHALQAQLRVGHQVSQQRAGVHAEVQEHPRHRYFHQGGEVHEHAKDHGHGIGRQGVAASQGLDPLGLDQLAHHADDEHAHDQQHKYLFHKSPGLPQPRAPVVGSQPPCIAPTAHSVRPTARHAAREGDLQTASLRGQPQCGHQQGGGG